MTKQTSTYWLTLAMAATAAPVAAAHADQTPSKTWFVDHPSARAEVNKACRADPENAKNVTLCANAEDAAEAVAIRDRGPKVIDSASLCDLMPPAFKAVNNCSVVARRK